MTELDDLDARVRREALAVERLVGQARLIAAKGRELAGEIDGLKSQIESLEQVVGVLNNVGEARQNKAQETIESLVTRGLQTIFGPDLSFHIVTGLRGKSTVSDFVVRTTLADGTVVETPILEARGGGLAATIGVLLRIVVLLLSDDGRSKTLVLDEPFAHVSAEYEIPLAQFLRDLVDKTDIQIVMVTHSDAYSDFADVKYRFSARNGRTAVEEV